MPQLCLQGGMIYDPVHGRDGEVGDLWIDAGRIVEPPADPSIRADRTLDLTGLVVMPGGIDMHCHIAGPKVNAARRLHPSHSRGPAPVVPSSVETGRLMAGLGYTTALDAAIPGLFARAAHYEFQDTPHIDKGFYVLLGNHHYVLEQIAAGETERLAAFCGWQMKATHGFAIKIVNPGGVENFKQISRKTLRELDEPVGEFGVTPRQIVRELAGAADALGLPHSIHVHCNNLGVPGNWETTLRTMEALEGRRGHFAHVQFNSYGGRPDDPASFRSEAPRLVDYVREHANITVDVGHVHPGRTLSITGDAPFAEQLRRLSRSAYFTADTEQEASCGVIPVEYRPQKSLVNAVQWATALEWYLLMDDPWRLALTSDHPNGGAFYRYPEMLHLLMDGAFRREALQRMPAGLRQRTILSDLDREYSLAEICIITRAAPARILGLSNKGHLGAGADADMTIYTPDADRRAMFCRPRWVIKDGRLIVEDGEIQTLAPGGTLHADCDYDAAALDVLPEWWNQRYSIRWANYAIPPETLLNLQPR